jgi:hypothetical protein
VVRDAEQELFVFPGELKVVNQALHDVHRPFANRLPGGGTLEGART